MSKLKKLNQGIQSFGRSLLLPIAVMAPVGMVLGITGAFVQSYMIAKLPFLGNPAVNTTLKSIRDVANIIFSNIPLLFAMGVAYGMAKKEKGIAVFSSVISYLILNMTINVWLTVTGNLAKPEVMANVGQGMVLGVQTLRLEALGGIIAGLIAAKATDKFYNLELPVAFAFFAGKKSVPIITIGITAVIGLIIPIFWQQVTAGLIYLSKYLLSDIFGTFLSGAMNRLLIPLGLHHVWNALIRFTPAGGTYTINGKDFIGILPALNELQFNLGPSSPAWSLMPKLTRFMAESQAINTLFTVPAIGLAMYKSAFPQNRKYVKGAIITMVLTAFLGNVTEPIEFAFMFVSPLLFIFHVIVQGIGCVFLYLMGTAVGYIRATIFDFAIFGLMYDNTKWYNIIIVGIPLFIIYYFVFTWAIKKFNIATPGRESDEMVENNLLKEKKYPEIAAIVVEALGGRENFANIDNCVTRLRVDLKDASLVKKDLLKTSGTSGFSFPGKNHIHVVFGPHVEFVRNAVEDEVMGVNKRIG